MLELTADNALSYLRQQQLVGKEPVDVTPLAWGVSNVVLRVETPTRRFVLKQSRPQLRTRDAWFSDLERVYREQEVMELLQPLLPSGIVPAVLYSDRPNYVFAMSHAPIEARVWKAVLLEGEVDLTLGEQAGRILGGIHETTARAPQRLEPFRDHTVFVQLRVDPFYRRVQERCPDVAAAITPLIHRLLTIKEALCHADYSPKNLLVHEGGFTLVDYETAHFGDPTFDLGFFLSHLLLKAVKRSGQAARFFDLTRAFWRGYEQEVRFQSMHSLWPRGIAHLAVCMLARIDGTSPVDYLTDERQRNCVRQLARQILRDQPTSWDTVLDMTSSAFNSASLADGVH